MAWAAAAPKSLLCCVLSAAITSGHASLAQTSVRDEGEIQRGVPLLVQGLALGETRCWRVGPWSESRVRVLASAVGLVGAPTVWGGWGAEKLDELALQGPHQPFDPSGLATFWKTLTTEGRAHEEYGYFVCLRTFSPEGCTASLTVQVANSADGPYPHMSLKTGYPSVWPLGDDSSPELDSEAAPGSLRLEYRADDLPSEDIRVSAVAVSGKIELNVFGVSCLDKFDESLPLASLSMLPYLLDIPERPASGNSLCIVVKGQGVVAVTAGPRLLHPFVAPQVPAVGRVMEPGSACEKMRLLMQPRLDMTITATAEDDTQLDLSASVLSVPIANSWEGAAPGGEGGVLRLRSEDVREASAKSGDQGVVTLTISICPAQSGHQGGGRLGGKGGGHFWLTAVTDSGVATLEDGVISATVVSSTSQEQASWGQVVGSGGVGAAASWRFFRFLVPSGVEQPERVTVSAESACSAYLTVDTQYLYGRAMDYQWAAATVNSSHPLIHMTTRPYLASQETHLIDCPRFPCFLYIAAWAKCDGDSEDADLQVLAISDKAGVTPLFEGMELEQTLGAGEHQVFRYTVLHPESNVLIAVSASEGTEQFLVSSSLEFPEDNLRTTPLADEVIMLEPRSSVFSTALSDAGPKKPAILFVKVLANGMDADSTFTVSARAEGDAEELRNGDDAVNGAVEGHDIDRYRFFIEEEEAQQDVEVSIKMHLFVGNPLVYVACEPHKVPNKHKHIWGGPLNGQDTLTFSTADKRFKAGWVYIGVAATAGEKAAYGIQVHWGNKDILLQDGVELTGHLPSMASRRYLWPSTFFPRENALALRAQALSGKVELCVGMQEACTYRMQVSDLSEEDSLAALDFPHGLLFGTKDLVIEVRGLERESSFALRAMATAPAKLAEDHNLVLDALGPSCCVPGEPWDLQLSRKYQRFVHPSVFGGGITTDIVVVEVHALGGGDLAGARMYLRRAQYSREEQLEGELKTYSFFQPDDQSVQELNVSGQAELLGGPNRASSGFWVEVEVQAIKPVNFSLSIRCAPAPIAPDSKFLPGVATPTEAPHVTVPEEGLRLLPNVPMKGTLSSPEGDAYELSLPGSFEEMGDSVRFGLRQCFGRAAVRHRKTGVFWQAVEAADIDEDLAWTVQASAISHSEVVTVAPESPLPVTYEVELMPHGKVSDIELPASTLLTMEPGAAKGYVALSFEPASSKRKDTKLKYELMALDAGDSRLNAATTCGLLEAAARQLAFVTPVEDSSVEAATLPGLDQWSRIPTKWLAKPGVYDLNILARLYDKSNRNIAERCYSPLTVNTTEMLEEKKLLAFLGQDGQDNNTQHNWVGLFGILCLAVICYRHFNRKSGPNLPNGRDAGFGDTSPVTESVEMEEQFSYQEVSDRRRLLSRGGGGNYIPPTV